MPVGGEGRRKVLFVAEAPGEEEDKRNTQLIGPAGQCLRRHLQKIGVDLDRDCWKTNAVICRPEGNPTAEQVAACRPNLLRTVRELEPEVIVLAGLWAVESLVGWLWRENVGKMGRWTGWRIPCQTLNAWVCPIYHPSYVMRTENDRQTGRVIGLWFDRHLKAAFELEGRPWSELPEYEKRVEVVVDVKTAAARIDEFVEDGSPTAFDYETNMLKPDSESAWIRCVGLSNGKWTVAFPLHGPAVPAMRRFFKSTLRKIAQNMKFEDRWTRAIFGVSVRNWWWDTMVAAHVLDNRKGGICGLKFQSFVTLGQESYDDSVKPFLQSTGGGNSGNRVREVDVRDLLLYCGMDALLTWEIARRQMEMMG